MNGSYWFPGLVAQASGTQNPPTPNSLEVWVSANPVTALLVALAIVTLVTLGIVAWRTWFPPAASTFSDDQFRHVVAKSVLFSAIWGTVAIAGLTILMPTSAKEVLTIVLPVFGTWIGTLLAYYFGKDNFESGARNAQDMAKALSGTEKLRAIPVTQPGIMIPLVKIELPAIIQGKRPADYGGVLLKDLRTQMQRQRLPLIDPDTGAAVAVIHRSLINDFLVKVGAARFDTATLKELLDDAEAGRIAKGTFVVLPNTKNLAEVKEAMARQSQQQAGVTCEDAFITPPGSVRVEGWITNDIISANALAYTSEERAP